MEDIPRTLLLRTTQNERCADEADKDAKRPPEDLLFQITNLTAKSANNNGRFNFGSRISQQ